MTRSEGTPPDATRHGRARPDAPGADAPGADARGADGSARIVHRHRELVGRTALVSGLTLISRLLGFVREVIMAAVFGDGSAVSDAFFTAWRVPNLFRRLLGEGALSTSLQATLTEADAKGGDALGRRLFLRTVWLATGILALVWALMTIAVAAMPDVMPVTGWPWLGLDPEPVRDLAVRLLPYVVLVCLAALVSGALHVRGHYFVPNLAPVVMNVTWIAALVAIGAAYGWSASAAGAEDEVFARQWAMARWLAWGVLVGGVIQLVIQVPSLSRFGLVGRDQDERERADPKEPAGDASGDVPGPWAVLRGAAPLAVGAAVYQINVMIDGLMAEGMLRDGGPSALYYANRVQQFPLALVATAAASSVFPALKAHAHLRELAPLRRLHDRTQLAVLFLALPAAIGVGVLAGPICTALFEHGNYGPEGTRRIASALEMLALALVPAGAVGLAGRTYIALGDARTPVRVSIWMMSANAGLNVALVVGLGMDVAGLALATALTSWGNLIWLLVGLRRRLGLPSSAEDLRPRLGRLLLAALVSGALAAGVDRLGEAAGLPPVARLLAAIAAGMAGFALAAHRLGLPEGLELRERIARRLRRRRGPGAGPDASA